MAVDPNYQVTDLIFSGLESLVCRAVAEDGTQLILKKIKERGAQQYCFEAHAYQVLAELGARVPRVVAVNDEHLLMTSFRGEELDDKEQLYGNEILWREVAQDLACCRKVVFSGYGPARQISGTFVGQYKSLQEYLTSVRRLFETSAFTSGLGLADRKQLERFWDATQPMINGRQSMLVHGDFAMSAIFVHDDTYEGLIDFGDALIGDPLMDLAHFRFKEITKPYGKELYRRLLKSYLQVTGLTADVPCERTIQFYMIYWAIMSLVYCPSEDIRKKYVGKTKVLVSEISA